MTIFRRAAGLVASGVFVLGLFYAAGAASAGGLMFINAKTNKCLTIAGGLSTANNVEAVQFDCDSDPVAQLVPDLHRAPGRHLLYQERADQQVPDYRRGPEHRQQRRSRAIRLRQRSLAHLVPDQHGPPGDIFYIKNVQTNKCLTIAGGGAPPTT